MEISATTMKKTVSTRSFPEPSAKMKLCGKKLTVLNPVVDAL